MTRYTAPIRLDQRWLDELQADIDRRVQPAIFAVERAMEVERVFGNALREIAAGPDEQLATAIAKAALGHADVVSPR